MDSHDLEPGVGGESGFIMPQRMHPAAPPQLVQPSPGQVGATSVEQASASRVSGPATASLILGILSFFLPILCAIPAVILGFVGLADVGRGQGHVGGKGLALTGIALSAASTLFACLVVPLTLYLLWPAGSSRQQFVVVGNDLGGRSRPVSFKEPPPATNYPGLLAYWDLDEGSGNRAADKSGKSNHGTLHGPTWVAGVRGKGLHFNGAPDYVDYRDGASLNFAADAPFTYCGWFRTKATEATILSQRNERDGGPDIDFNMTGGMLEVIVREDAGEFGTLARVSSKEWLNDGNWHHFALTRKPGGRIDLYVHGAWQATSTGTNAAGAITTNLRALGSERYWVKRDFQTNDRSYFRGDLDEICIFGRALTSAEIEKLAGQ